MKSRILSSLHDTGLMVRIVVAISILTTALLYAFHVIG